MIPLSFGAVCKSCFLLLLVFLAANSAFAQLETAAVSGQVVDPSGLSITGAQVKLVDIDRQTTTAAATNTSGLYAFPSVRPGRYRMEVTAAGFKVVNVTGLTVNVQDHIEQNFRLAVGSVSESVTVEGGAPQVDTESAAVSTVVDRNFAENLPMNGRSFQSLIELTPGVVLTPGNVSDGGQFSVDGQRPSSNYWMVDGVSANIGVGTGGNPGNGFGGTLGSFSVLGGTNSLVSVDALQEFRIQTSTYAPEFGRTPGGQISILTRSGNNQFHGTGFDYFRNTVLDANNWFADSDGLQKPEERQNDFGGTFGGPIVKDRTFFFFSYEGLRLRLPYTVLTTVPDSDARQSPNAIPSMQPYLDAYPEPNPNSPDLTPGIAPFDASFSNPASLDAYSLRIDHRLNQKLTLFGRYNYSPSQIASRGGATGLSALSVVETDKITTQTATIGATWAASPSITNDFRFNYSRVNGSSRLDMTTFGGAVPLSSLSFPTPFDNQNSVLFFDLSALTTGYQLAAGQGALNLQRQINVVDNLSKQLGSHSLKFGVDFRRLSPEVTPPLYTQFPIFLSLSSAQAGDSFFVEKLSADSATLLFHNLGIFAQDTWRLSPRLTLTYGLRWDFDFAPSSLDGPSIPAVSGYNLNNLSQLTIEPAGTPPFKTTYGNLAPRIGAAYQVSQNQDWQTVFRGGFGVFYDLVSAETGTAVGTSTGSGFPPFGASSLLFGSTFPLDSAQSAPLPIPTTGTLSQLFAFNPNLKLPYTLEWNIAVEQALGNQEMLSVSYIGAVGRRLLQTTAVSFPQTNPNITEAQFVDNTATSNYNALQIQFQRRLTHGLQALASYTWSHSIDDGSASSSLVSSNGGVPGSSSNANRGPSDFDIRNAFSAGMTYEIQAPKGNALTNTVIRGWSIQNFILARSAPPVTIYNPYLEFDSGVQAAIRPDIIPGQPFYLFGAQCAAAYGPLSQGGNGELLGGQSCPGGKGFNPNAFTNPPIDPTTGLAIRQGDLPRNALRGFGAAQWDFAVHRDFRIHEAVRLQFRAEMFNVLNHPSFGQPNAQFGNAGFGLSYQTLGQYLSAGNAGGGALSPLYQIGGPRSIQFALKLSF